VTKKTNEEDDDEDDDGGGGGGGGGSTNNKQISLWLNRAFLRSIECLLPTNGLNVNVI
jgi:hypothetical protein